MKNLFYIMLLCIGIGCVTPTTGNFYDLQGQYNPLLEIKERSDQGKGPGWIETRGQYAYVSNLDDWLKYYYPPDSVEFRALMLHEQVHSARQGTGLEGLIWEFFYNWVPGVKWEEEKLGWEQELRYLLERDAAPNKDYVADLLMSYDMASEEEVRAWLDRLYREYE